MPDIPSSTQHVAFPPHLHPWKIWKVV